MSLIFVPLSPDQLRDWAHTGILSGEVAAHEAGASLAEAFGASDAEDVERITLLVASVAGLTRSGCRLVAVMEADPLPRPGADHDFGEVLVADPRYAAVSALFADEVRSPVVAKAAAAGRMPLAEAWEHPAVRTMLADADLLWHGPEEWESVVAGCTG